VYIHTYIHTYSRTVFCSGILVESSVVVRYNTVTLKLYHLKENRPMLANHFQNALQIFWADFFLWGKCKNLAHCSSHLSTEDFFLLKLDQSFECISSCRDLASLGEKKFRKIHLAKKIATLVLLFDVIKVN
jgi:hypothetical protein